MNNDYSKTTLHQNLQSVNHVLVIEDENSRKTMILKDAEYSIGRDPRNKIALASKKISRFHATLLRRTDTKNKTFSYWLLDGDLQGNRSTNGIYINDKRCLVQELKHEDVIKLGYEVKLSYYITNSISDLMLLQSGDFQSSATPEKAFESSAEESMTKAHTFSDKETVIISEASLESLEHEQQNTDVTRLASFPELSPNPIIELDWEGKVIYLNPSARKKFPELQNAEVNSSESPLLVGLLKGIKNTNASNNLFVREIKVKNKVFEQYIHYLHEQKLIRSYIFDFTQRSKLLENQLEEGEQRYKAIINQAKNGIFLVDAVSNKILEANNAIGDLLGYDLQEIYSLMLPDLIIPDHWNYLQEQIKQLINQETEQIKQEFNYKHLNQSFVKLDSTINLINYGDQKILFFTVQSASSKVSQETVIQDSGPGLYDLETGLPNRELFIQQLNTAMANSHRNQGLLCIFFIELELQNNQSDTVNYNLKYNILQGFAKRLRASLRLGDTVARWQDNQFVALLPQISKIKDVGRVSERILQTLKPPFFLENKKIYTKTSIGVAVKEDEIYRAEILVNNAEQALQKSKESGSDNYKIFNPKTQKEIERLLRLEKLLENALNFEEFKLYYQPQINFKTKEITGIETLIRWQHPELGKITPIQFMPLAEETGLIVPIGEWIIKTACLQRKIWQKNGVIDKPISINISTQEFQQPNFVRMISDILKDTGLEAGLLELELREQTITADQNLTARTLSELNQLGVKICLDDFGSGLSPIGILKQFRFRTLKIDQNLIKNLCDNPSDLTILSSVVKICHNFNVRVVAEGVENREQLDLISSLDCQEIQGNILTELLSKDDVTNFLANPNLKF
jgi:diguanylate cyclase (GGDEF)-like protein/PAS domain S-box-containing protein